MTKWQWYALLAIRLTLAAGVVTGLGWLLYDSRLPMWAKVVLDTVVIGGVLAMLVVGPVTYSQRRRVSGKIDAALAQNPDEGAGSDR
jgi:hypothetical protein